MNKAVNLEALNKWNSAIPPHVKAKIDSVAPLLNRLGYRTDVPGSMDYSKHLSPVAEQSIDRVLA